jgi:hypothetical protein
MSRNVVLIVALLLALSIDLPSSAVAMPTDTLTILPEDCKILAGKELSLTVDGVIPSNTTINWDASDGGITSVLPGSDAIFIAPFKSTVVTISVSISPAVPGMESLITRQCIVTSPNRAPDGVAQAAGMMTSSLPVISFSIN